VKPGDLLTLPRGRDVLVVRILACGERRGPAQEAQSLYEILNDSVLDPDPRAP
jgi:ribosome-associated heat shock protein Hsp15